MPNTLSLVQTTGQKAFTTSLVIAANCPVERKDKLTGKMVEFSRDHRDVMKLIRQFQSDFKEFGEVRFETALNPQGSPTEYVILSEDQATYLVTLFANSKVVRRFKIKLVKAFRQALDRIAEGFANPPRTGLSQEKRLSHWDMTGALKEAREEAGKYTEAKHFMCENKLCNSCITGKYAKLDEATLDNDQLVILKKVRVKNAAYIRADMDYAERKVKLHAYVERLRTLKLIA